MALQIIHEFTCDFCGKVKREHQGDVGPWAAVVSHAEPCGWKWVGDKLACEKHEFVVDPPMQTADNRRHAKRKPCQTDDMTRFYLRTSPKPLALDLAEVAAIHNTGLNTRVILRNGAQAVVEMSTTEVADLIERWRDWMESQTV